MSEKTRAKETGGRQEDESHLIQEHTQTIVLCTLESNAMSEHSALNHGEVQDTHFRLELQPARTHTS